MTQTLGSKERAQQLAAAAVELKGREVVALDVSGLTSFADAFVLATGTSDRHVRAVAESVLAAAKATGSVLGVEGLEEGRWVLIDAGDVVAHVFLADVREYYDLDRLWADAAPIPLPAEPGAPARRDASA